MDFDFQQRLGAGHFGEVWLAIDTGLNVKRAVKLIPPDRVPDKNNFFREAQLLKQSEHPNIVRVEATEIMPDGRVCVAMEYLPKRSIDDEASGGYLPLTRVKRIMVDLLRGLEYAHSQGIIHHDIKPGNILVGNSGEGKLSDFGLAISPRTDPRTVAVKHYNYTLHLAPEIYTSHDYSILSDVYACGITLYRLVNGDSFLPSVPLADVPDLSCKGQFPDRSKYRSFIPRPIRTIINKAMEVDPSARYQSAQGLRRALEGVDIQMNWNEQIFSDHVRWSAGWDYRCYEVTLQHLDNDRCNVIVRKGRSKESLRRINALCHSKVTLKQGDRAARRVLQDYVLGRHS